MSDATFQGFLRYPMNTIDLAERVRSAMIDAAIQAYEDAGISGLCLEGRWEAAVGAMRMLDLKPVLDSASRPDEPRPA